MCFRLALLPKPTLNLIDRFMRRPRRGRGRDERRHQSNGDVAPRGCSGMVTPMRAGRADGVLLLRSNHWRAATSALSTIVQREEP